MACWGPPPFGPPPGPFAGPPPGLFPGPPTPQPAMYGNTRYHYHTRDGGPPNDGKPPDAPAPGSAIPPFGFAPVPPGLPFGAPPAPPAMACFAPPPAAAPSGYACFPFGSAPAPAPTPASPPAAMTYAGAIYAGKSDDDGPAPGNRVNGRLAKVDDGSGILLPEDMTTFHVLNPGCHPDRTKHFKRDMKFKVQTVDSSWTVKTLIKRLGGLQEPRLQRDWIGREDLVAIEEWHEVGNGEFRKGTTINYTAEKASCTLIELGWGPDRGKAGRQPPVWVVLYPVKPM